MGFVQKSETNSLSKAKLLSLPNIGHTQKKILRLLFSSDNYWNPATGKPRICLLAKKIGVTPAVIHRSLYGTKSGKNGSVGLFNRFHKYHQPANKTANKPANTGTNI